MFLTNWYRTLKNYWRLKKAGHNTAVDLTTTDEEHPAWWGNFTVTDQQARYSKIDHLVLCIDRTEHEWRITQHFEERQYPSKTKTFSSQSPVSEIRLSPSLPDRTLLSPLEHPLCLPPKETVLIYATSPIWVQLDIGASALFQDEIVLHTLTDTWSGKDTIEGELCYAGSPVCHRIEDIAVTHTQVFIPISILNNAAHSICLEEIKIPLPYLSIYADPHHHLWTEQLNVFFEDSLNSETLIAEGPPQGIQNLTLVGEPRIPSVSRFKRLFKLRRKSS